MNAITKIIDLFTLRRSVQEEEISGVNATFLNIFYIIFLNYIISENIFNMLNIKYLHR